MVSRGRRDLFFRNVRPTRYTVSVPNDTLTLILDGTVSLDDFTAAIRHFHELVGALQRDRAPAANIRWTIASLEVSSAVTAIRGVADDPDQVEQVVRAYEEVGRTAEQNGIDALPDTHRKPIAGLLRLVTPDGVDAIRLETSRRTAVLNQQPGRVADVAGVTGDRGAVEGRIQTLSSRGGLRFTLYDTLLDKAVSCYLKEGFENIMRDTWGKLATVEGIVQRDRTTGRPLTVRQVTSVASIREASDSYKRSRGTVTSTGVAPEAAIRAVRDA